MANFLQRMLMGGPLVGTGGWLGGPSHPMATPPILPNAAPQQPSFPPMGANAPKWLQKVAGGVDRLASGLAGGQSPQAHQAMLATLLANSGPAPVGTRGLLQPFGEAMMAGQQAQSAFDENEMRRKLVEAQIGALNQPKGSERADPAAIREMAALGYPMTREGFADYNRDRGSDNPVTDQLAAIQAQLAVDQRKDQIARDRRADEDAVQAAAQQRSALRGTIRRSVQQTGDIAGLVEGLEGSFLSAGLPASSWRRTAASAWAGLAGAAGADTSKLESEIGKFDKLKKGLSDQLINLMSTGALGEATNAKLQQFQDALANTETSPPAIMSIQAGIAETLLEAADAQGVEIESRDKIEENIKRWRLYESPAREPVADFSKMTDEELRRIVNGE